MKTSLQLVVTGAVAVTAFGFGRWTARSNSTSAASGNGAPSAVVTRSPASAAAAPGGDNKSDGRESARFAEAAAQAPKSFAAEEERQRLIEQWAEKDPLAAMTFARTQMKGDRQAQATAAILAIWGKNDPEAAWNWVSKEMPTATHHFDTLLEAFGRVSAETAGRYAAKFAAEHPGTALEVHLAALLGVTHRGDFAAARALVDANPALEPEVRGNLHNFIAGQWARFAPEEASRWVMSLPEGELRKQALIGLGESWSDVDPRGAAAFAVALPPGETRSLAMRQAIGKWVMTDPDAARGWVIQTDRHEDFDQAVGSIATDYNLVNREPGRALQWAATIFDDTLRARSVDAIFFNWYPRDPKGATAYLETAREFTPQQRAELLSRLHAATAENGG